MARAVGTKQAEPLRQAVAPLIRANYDNAEERLVDLDLLVEAAARVPRLSDVAADHALEPPRSTGDLAGVPAIDEDWLTISTMHSAKGMEWDVVHVIHAADGNIPSDMALNDRNGLEEERRLFYVAMTRPRRRPRVRAVALSPSTSRARRPPLLGAAVALPHRQRRSDDGSGHFAA